MINLEYSEHNESALQEILLLILQLKKNLYCLELQVEISRKNDLKELCHGI